MRRVKELLLPNSIPLAEAGQKFNQIFFDKLAQWHKAIFAHVSCIQLHLGE